MRKLNTNPKKLHKPIASVVTGDKILSKTWADNMNDLDDAITLPFHVFTIV